MKARILVVLLIFTFSCQEGNEEAVLQIPSHFPLPNLPGNNKLTAVKAELGKKLFYEEKLSRDSSVSCGSCHLPDFAFSDTTALSSGAGHGRTFRNTPTLVNLAWRKHFFREGGVASLERTVLAPLLSEDEMDIDLFDAAARLESESDYRRLFREVFDSVPNPSDITHALAAFQYTLVSASSPFDRYMQGDSSALNADEIRGYELFRSGRTACSQCHSGVNFTDEDFHNTGLYEEYPDDGRARLTLKERDRGKFMTPTLRNVSLTAPYMHDGSLESLDEVIEFYEKGGKEHPNKSRHIRPFELSSGEKQDLVAFLESLADTAFVRNSRFHP